MSVSFDVNILLIFTKFKIYVKKKTDNISRVYNETLINLDFRSILQNIYRAHSFYLCFPFSLYQSIMCYA